MACENRLTKGKKLLSKVKHPAEPHAIHNSQRDTPRVMQTKFSKTVMVYGCVSCEGDVMPPHFFHRESQVELRYLHGVAN